MAARDFGRFGDVAVELFDDFVALAEIRRPPNNFFSRELIESLADAFEALDAEDGCRAIVLGSEGKNFCAGADFSSGDPTEMGPNGEHLYDEAVRLFAARKPSIAAVQGAAVGGGLGVALMPDFRVASPESRFSANFSRLAFHQGFGITVTLPRLVGQQAAMDLLYTGRRVKGEEAKALGLCDRLVAADQIRSEAHAFAREIALSGPLAVEAIRQTLRGDLAAAVREATYLEKAVQDRLGRTQDFSEGKRAMAERRTPDFKRC